MPKPLASLTLLAAFAMIGCATVDPAMKLGMQNAISASEREQVAAAQASVAAKPVEPTTASPVTPVGPPPELSELEAMAEIAPALAELAAADSQLHGEVLEQLGGTQPHLWSLTVQRAQHTLAYRQQLASSQPLAPQPLGSQPSESPQPSTPHPLPPVVPETAPPVIQASATTPIAPRPTPPLPVVVGAPAAPAVTSNPHYRLASAAAPDVPPLAVEPEVEVLAWREHLAKAIARFKETHKNTKPASREEAEEHIRLRLLQLAAGETSDAATAPPNLTSAEQGYWSNQLWAMSTLLEGEEEDLEARVNAAGRHQEQASSKLAEMGELEVLNLTACELVYGYGAYKAVREATYEPGQSVRLYTEVKNYRSRVTEEGYNTLISSECRLLDSNGDVAMRIEIPAVDDICLTRRRDFHLDLRIVLPTGLREGQYRLELTVNDRLGGKTGRSDLPIRIASR